MVISLRNVIALMITWSLILSMVLSQAACNKKVEEKPKTAEQLQAEKAAIDKSVRDNPVYGNQMKALDQAKEVQKAVDAQAAEQAKKIDDATK